MAVADAPAARTTRADDARTSRSSTASATTRTPSRPSTPSCSRRNITRSGAIPRSSPCTAARGRRRRSTWWAAEARAARLHRDRPGVQPARPADRLSLHAERARRRRAGPARRPAAVRDRQRPRLPRRPAHRRQHGLGLRPGPSRPVRRASWSSRASRPSTSPATCRTPSGSRSTSRSATWPRPPNEVIFGSYVKPLIPRPGTSPTSSIYRRGLEDFPEEVPTDLRLDGPPPPRPVPRSRSTSSPPATCDDRFYGVVDPRVPPGPDHRARGRRDRSGKNLKPGHDQDEVEQPQQPGQPQGRRDQAARRLGQPQARSTSSRSSRSGSTARRLQGAGQARPRSPSSKTCGSAATASRSTG